MGPLNLNSVFSYSAGHTCLNSKFWMAFFNKERHCLVIMNARINLLFIRCLGGVYSSYFSCIEWKLTFLLRSALLDSYIVRFIYCCVLTKNAIPTFLGAFIFVTKRWFIYSSSGNAAVTSSHLEPSCKTHVKIMWSTCKLKKFDENCCEIVNFIPNLSENETLIKTTVLLEIVLRAFFLSSNLQRNAEGHKTLTQISICGTVWIVAVLAWLTNDN